MPRSKFCARGPGIFPPLPDSMEFPDPFGWWVRRSVCSIALLLVCLDCASDSSSYRALLPFDSKVATLPLNLQSLSPDKYIHLLKFAPEPWARGVKSFIIAFPMSGSLTLLKVDTTSAFQHLTSKLKEIEYCDEYQSTLLRWKSHRRAQKLTTHLKAPQFLVHRSITTSFTDVLALMLGALATLGASLQVSIMGIMTTIVITTKANPTRTTTAPTAPRSTCRFEQMPVSDGQGCCQLQSAGRA